MSTVRRSETVKLLNGHFCGCRLKVVLLLCVSHDTYVKTSQKLIIRGVVRILIIIVAKYLLLKSVLNLLNGFQYVHHLSS